MTQTDLSHVSCAQLTGVGPKLAEKLAKRGIQNLQDLLFHLPYRYQDRTRITPIAHCKPGIHALLEGDVVNSSVLRIGKPQLQCVLRDATGQMQLRFFYFTAAQKNSLSKGQRIRCFGEVRYARHGLEIIHPEYQIITNQQSVSVEETLHPVYPSTEGLSQQSLYKLTTQALKFLEQGHLLQELLPSELINRFNLPDLKTALLFLHRPPPQVQLRQLESGENIYQTRLIFEELLAHQLSMLRLKQNTKQEKALPLQGNQQLTQQFIANLPFTLTNAQQKVTQEILDDIKNLHPMMRLVQGDVGSGKTVVAAMSLLTTVEAGYQGALMAPTEILAEQHYQNFKNWLEPMGIEVVWLAGKTKGKARQLALEKIANGEAQIVVGTHALFQDSVKFKQLGLMVIDEQHRFGVHQRLALRGKGEFADIIPHQLIMTATPIPRTLAMSCYADLDMSVIDELPPGRTPVTTVVVSNTRRAEIIDRVKTICELGRQVYWVCTLIEDSEVLTSEAAEKTTLALTQSLPNLSVALVHGRMKSKEKETIMASFKAGEIHLLVATTVIEVGVDVPNASLMIIENAERLGLAQLHQLRGRVGRGSAESHCVLMYQTPLSHVAKQRLSIMRETTDGFKIAQKDLDMRGPGEILGTRQTGVIQFRIADLMRDKNWLTKAHQAAQWLLQTHPELVEPLIKRWLGDSEQFVNA